jgi:hypothetical protein
MTKINFEMAKIGLHGDGRRAVAAADSSCPSVSTGRLQAFGNGPAND